jgi:hypothetical protein
MAGMTVHMEGSDTPISPARLRVILWTLVVFYLHIAVYLSLPLYCNFYFL